ncbi:MAG: amidohydrolase [Melioribacteraceae bacterium]|nr:amidohydrolase [Melioribacteraceae bacterium]
MKLKSLIQFVFVNLILIISLQGCGGKEMKDSADLVLINGVIATMDDSSPSAEAIAIKGNKILFVGSTEDAEMYIGDSTEVIDLKGKFVMPGFIESHAHFLGLGKSKQMLDLREARNWDEVIAIVARACESVRPGDWILGGGWHQEKFDPAPYPNVHGYPVHNELSKASPNNPVMLSHASGHAIFVNERAMKLAGVSKATVDPDGGTIVRDSTGTPIGVFEENAENIVGKFYEEYFNGRKPEEIRQDYIDQIRLASEESLRKGITSFHDAGETFELIDLIKEQADSNKLQIRLNIMIGDTYDKMKEKIAGYRLIGYANNFLTVRSIKQYIDGALGSRGAWMIEPYSDLPTHSGSNVTSIETLKKISALAVANGFQMRIHAIGDLGNREVLSVYEEVFNKNSDKKDLRWSIEHAQHLSANDIPRFAKLGVTAAMQAIHCTSDATFVPERIGEARAEEGAYVWKKLIESGAIICNGTDAPVEDVNPISCFYSSVTRRLADRNAFYPGQKMSRMEALRSYTVNGAYASFEENIKGSLKTGMLADVVVLSNDLLTCPEDEIPSTKVLYTIVAGKILFQHN